MKKTSTFLFLTLLLITSSCNTSSTSSEAAAEEPKSQDEVKDELYQEVIEVHDIAMLKMQTIMNLKSNAIKEADSLRDLGDQSKTSRIALLEEMQVTLEDANNSMMTWMREFKPLPDTVAYDQAMEYLRSEQDKITEVNDRMGEVIEEAEAL